MPAVDEELQQLQSSQKEFKSILLKKLAADIVEIANFFLYSLHPPALISAADKLPEVSEISAAATRLIDVERVGQLHFWIAVVIESWLILFAVG
ncbi:hypothetical protein LSTR_LSTR009335 [Laodelphax striatellus]|uniref:Uncharacterized protein n=1 Tax=Laodelphax striatellus TaxID=195883 RepID=A0A482XIG6_LAOST|nr:hypothetical protein LSTR_LSTR009335 [Laodelphax striatellus]